MGTKCSKIGLSFVIKFLVEKYKPCKIYRITLENVLAKIMFINGLNLSLPRQTYVEKKEK